MKNYKYEKNIKYVLLIAISAFLTLTFTSCAKKTTFNTSTIVPAARGEITVKKDKNNNYDVHLQLSYLAEPERLQPAKKTYVVWMVPSDNDMPINLGQIVGTSKLKIKFETVSSSKPIKIFITGEDDASVQYPGNMVVLETNKF